MKQIPLTVKEIQKGLIDKEFSAVEIVDSYLEGIEKHNDDINIFLTVTDEVAYKKAKQVDQLISDFKGKKNELLKMYPLLGVVVSYKDIFATKGIRTTAGSKVLEFYIPQYSATIVKKIEDAGGIMIGKVNMDAWAHGSSGENSDFSPTKNPWDKTRVPGGSSSGSAASLSSNMSLVSTGTDTCGSIRLPANYCGVYGLKPTYGVVSRYGTIAMASSLDSVGCFGRTADDIKSMFDVMKGKDAFDATLKSINKNSEYANKPLTIGVPKEFFQKGLNKEIDENIKKAIMLFEDNGYEIKQISLPHTKYAISVYYIIQPAEVSSNLGRYDGIRYGKPRTSFQDEAKRRIMLGSYVLSAGYFDKYYLKAMKVRSVIKDEINKAFEDVDVIIAPVAPTPPFKLGAKINDPLEMYLTDIYAATANLSGIPSLSIPFGFSKNDLPLGFQLMGKRFSEKTIFKVAREFEKISNYKPVLPRDYY